MVQMDMAGRNASGTGRRPLASSVFERALAYGCMALLVIVGAALERGGVGHDRQAVLLCLALTPILLLGRRGARRHRQLGYLWVASMSATALLTFGIRDANHGGFSPIHMLSAITLTQAPMLAWHAHMHRVDAHRYTVLSLVGGALLIAGLFTLPFGRMLGRWLLG